MGMTPICIDLYAGLGGWAEGFLAEGYDVIGFDTERHDYGTGGYPGQLVIQDVLTLHGKQFRSADIIVASPPCQEYSYMAMPWTRAKQIALALRGQGEFPESYTGSKTVAQLTSLFDACYRLQREACETAGRYIPMVVENVRGARPWVGRSQWNFGSYHLWGDVPALMPIPSRAQKFNPDGTNHGQGSWFAVADSKNRGEGTKVPSFRFDGNGGSFQTASVKRINAGDEARDFYGSDGGPLPIRGLDCSFSGEYNDARTAESSDVFSGMGNSFGWSRTSPLRNNNSKSLARKAASAQIAKIPFALSNHIARVYRPTDR